MMNGMQERLSQLGAEPERLQGEEEILAEAVAGKWERALDLAENLGRPMDRGAANLCMEYALQSASNNVFDRFLKCVPKGEYTGTAVVPCASGKCCGAEVTGTLVTLAAAQGKAEKLKSLLAHGWDVNSASMDAATALKLRGKHPDGFYRAAMTGQGAYSASPESSLRTVLDMEDGPNGYLFHEAFYGITPLAAAILCGQAACAHILMDHGAWKEESPCVARALTLRQREHAEAYQACREAVLNYGDAPRPMALWAVIRSMPEGTLATELRRCKYDDEAIAKCVWELTIHMRMMPNRGIWAEERKRDLTRLQILEQQYPHVLRRPELVAAMIRCCMLLNETEAWQDFILKLCPEELDLSILREGLIRTPARKACAFLRKICEGRHCVMDRDSVPPMVPVLVLKTLLQEVEFLPPVSGGSVSGLTCAILDSGNLRLIRKALMTGAIPPEESRALLLRYLDTIPSAAHIRTLLLTTPRPEPQNVRLEHHRLVNMGPMFRWQPPEIRKIGYEALLEPDCPKDLIRELILRGVYDYRETVDYETAEGKWEAKSILSLLCWTGCADLVERWVHCGGKDVLQDVKPIRPAGEPYTLNGTPLCVAAYAGQADVVKRLLQLGAAAEERHHGVPCTLRTGKESLPITPLLAAMVRGHWEIVRLLQNHGASCDTEQCVVQKLWDLHNEKDLRQTLAQVGAER